MKVRTVCIGIPAFAAALLAAAPDSNALSSRRPPRTVVDYFLKLPNRYFDILPRSRAVWIRRPGSTVDVRSGYIDMQGDGAQIHLTVCLFRRDSGGYVVAVGNNGFDDPEHESFLDLWSYSDGRWRRQDSLFPGHVDMDLVYVLPRHGRTIHVQSRSGRHLYDVVWNGSSFRRGRK